MEMMHGHSSTDKMGDMGMDDAMKERLSMLKSKEKDGTLTDSDRSELQQLTERMGSIGSMETGKQ